MLYDVAQRPFLLLLWDIDVPDCGAVGIDSFYVRLLPACRETRIIMRISGIDLVWSGRGSARARVVLFSVLLLCAPNLSQEARAALCGDDVQGRRVPCACGDVVVSDTTLQAGDPVVAERCQGSGLFLKARPGAQSLRLDLAGLSLLGSGFGSGIRVVNGGRRGAVITGDSSSGKAEIVGFGTGIFAHGTRAVLEVSGVTVKGSRGNGLWLRSSGARVTNVSSQKNGGDGFRLDGHACVYSGLSASGNHGSGLRLSGESAMVDGRLEANLGNGATVSGRGHDLTGVEALGNGGAGLALSGRGHRVAGARLTGNAGPPIKDNTATSEGSR